MGIRRSVAGRQGKRRQPPRQLHLDVTTQVSWAGPRPGCRGATMPTSRPAHQHPRRDGRSEAPAAELDGQQAASGPERGNYGRPAGPLIVACTFLGSVAVSQQQALPEIGKIRPTGLSFVRAIEHSDLHLAGIDVATLVWTHHMRPVDDLDIRSHGKVVGQ